MGSTHTAVIWKVGDQYVALCPELDVASQGATVEEATSNRAVPDDEEIARRVRA